MQRVLRAIVPAAALMIASGAWAAPLYKDKNWGVVRQDGGKVCIVVLNSDSRRNAFHFLIDGEQNTASVGILDEFLPDTMNAEGSTVATLDVGPAFSRTLEFRRQFDGAANYLSASLAPHEFDSIFAALVAGHRGVNLSFENGDTWRIPSPERKEAAAAITECRNGALSRVRTTAT
jgi:hypothetical protein